MAYLHCHGKDGKCHWSQDDWWDFKIGKRHGYYYSRPTKIGWAYNPFSVFLSYVFTEKGYWYPRRIMMDRYWAKQNNCRIDPHSWWFAWKEFTRIFKKFKNQKWRTYEDFKKDHDAGKAVCPSCGEINFDID